MGKRIPVGKPPDKGSFPIDHFGECTNLKSEYMKCLKENQFDNMSCRYLSKQYLECRMDKDLMSKEPMHNLGFIGDEDTAPKPPRRKKDKKSKEETGWVVGMDGVKPDRHDNWRAPTLISW
eukprot:CAMPEP_0169194718 /NCGR_PEP_ID=MMETSP1016-20121227/6840_1 /TAXON_ID=342587 /ORGANISM="Karlodinium micrum, Strain CCMP2283" /LENGTH=120 /DNA_ID=CAMNT_0009271229 /DNA_START=68 /DNA_END=427 /DNA_ORIENTATION=+